MRVDIVQEEEIAWQLVNNLTARIGTRLARSGLFLAVASFLIGGVLAVMAGDQPAEISLKNFGEEFWVTT